MYAIIKTGGKQYTVKPGDVIDIEKIEGEAGDKIQLPVIFLNDGTNVVTDPEAAAKNTVTAEIVEQHKGPKAIIFKFKKRKGYKKKRGHRQNLTKVVVTEVAGVKAEAKPAAPKAEKKAEPKAEAPKAPKAEAKEAAKDLSSMTVAELKAYAAEKDIKLPSSARKAEIISIIENA